MSAKKKNLHGVDIVTASAGTGKTYHLTSMIEEETIAGRKPETILATTFTIKAAEELRERIRGRLLEKGLARAGHSTARRADRHGQWRLRRPDRRIRFRARPFAGR